jgi:ubiquinone/menaquinone biosynthesis C-methylase UbiE
VESRKFPPEHLARLNDPERLELLRPQVLWAAADVPADATVVDVGAGTGLFSVAFARLAPQARFYAADISPVMIEFMRAHLPDYVAARITPVAASESAIPLADGVADLVMMIAVYHELDDRQASLAEASRLLRPAGRLLIADWKKGDTGASGPSDETRLPTPLILDDVAVAGFREVRSHETLEHFAVVTATRV